MHPAETRLAAYRLFDRGFSTQLISQELGVARRTVADWLRHRYDVPRPKSTCFACDDSLVPADRGAYLYLLGQYLGDGYLVMSVRVPRLRIACADSYPGIAAEADAAMVAISGNRVSVVQNPGCTDRAMFWMHWPCVFPQHGPGPKHRREIRLHDWQVALVEAEPWPLLRGLIHSDGCRSMNRIHRGRKTYSYPRFNFSNESADIIGIFTRALDLVGVHRTMCRPNMVSVARRGDVAIMDEHIGPKY